jgi:hypothetical protein
MQLDSRRVVDGNAKKLSFKARGCWDPPELYLNLPTPPANALMPIGCGRRIGRLGTPECIVLDLSMAKANPGVSLVLSNCPSRATRKAPYKGVQQQTAYSLLAGLVSLMPRKLKARRLDVVIPMV